MNARRNAGRKVTYKDWAAVSAVLAGSRRAAADPVVADPAACWACGCTRPGMLAGNGLTTCPQCGEVRENV